MRSNIYFIRALPWAMFFCPFGAMFPFGELSFGFMGCGNWNFFFLGPLPLIFQTPKHSLLPPPHIVQNTLSHKTPHFPLTTKKNSQTISHRLTAVKLITKHTYQLINEKLFSLFFNHYYARLGTMFQFCAPPHALLRLFVAISCIVCGLVGVSPVGEQCHVASCSHAWTHAPSVPQRVWHTSAILC